MNASQAACADEVLDQLIAQPQTRKRRRTELDRYLQERQEKIQRALEVGNTIGALAAQLHKTLNGVSEKTLSRKIARLVVDAQRGKRRRRHGTRAVTAIAGTKPSAASPPSARSTARAVKAPNTSHAGLREDDDL